MNVGPLVEVPAKFSSVSLNCTLLHNLLETKRKLKRIVLIIRELHQMFSWLWRLKRNGRYNAYNPVEEVKVFPLETIVCLILVYFGFNALTFYQSQWVKKQTNKQKQTKANTFYFIGWLLINWEFSFVFIVCFHCLLVCLFVCLQGSVLTFTWLCV